MSNFAVTRRELLKTTLGAAALGGLIPEWFADLRADEPEKSPNERHVIGCIGTGDRWKQVIPGARRHGDVVAVCDVDRAHAEEGRAKTGGKAEIYEDYRKVLDRKDIDVVTIVTPDHWHSKIAIEALQAGKDIYCEKPLTLTIDEGKLIRDVLKKSKQVFQVGTQQRTEMGGRFITAVALVRDGRIGKLQKVTAAIGGAPAGGPFKTEPVPPGLNWDMWLGQAPFTDYIKQRCHYEFRWWYEYSGGKMTDWGAHHVDISQWGIGADDTGPLEIEGTATIPNIPNGYNTATEFNVKCRFAGDVELTIRHDGENGVTFIGDKGEIFVSRGALKGQAVDELKNKPLPEELLSKLLKGQKPGNHMDNFFACVKTREQPISDVYTHHRAMTTCHLANIAIRLGRKIKWDPAAEQIVGDSEAQSWQAREQRKGYEIKV
jgi:predicted dehydrogenase